MENIGSLIFIIIVINIISAIMRAIKGGKQKSQQAVQQAAVSPPPLPRSRIKLWVEDEDPEEEYDREFEMQDPFLSAETYSAETGYQSSQYEPEAEEYVKPPRKKAKPAAPAGRPLKKDAAVEQPCPQGINDLFKDKNAFLTSYILHEILEPPVTRRKRRTL